MQEYEPEDKRKGLLLSNLQSTSHKPQNFLAPLLHFTFLLYLDSFII